MCFSALVKKFEEFGDSNSNSEIVMRFKKEAIKRKRMLPVFFILIILAGVINGIWGKEIGKFLYDLIN